MRTVLETDMTAINNVVFDDGGNTPHFGKITNIVQALITAPKGLDGRSVVLSAPDGDGSFVSLLLDTSDDIAFDIRFEGEALTLLSSPREQGVLVRCANGKTLRPEFVNKFLATMYCQIASNEAAKNTQQLRVAATSATEKKSKPTNIRFRLINAPLTFPRGVEIETKQGSKSIDALQVGDEVLTVDNGWQPVRWVGSRVVDADTKNAPIFIKQGALGNTEHMTLAPETGIVLRGRDVRNLVGTRINSLPAKDFVNGREVRAIPRDRSLYYHFGLDRPQVIFTQGLMVKVAQIQQ